MKSFGERGKQQRSAARQRLEIDAFAAVVAAKSIAVRILLGLDQARVAGIDACLGPADGTQRRNDERRNDEPPIMACLHPRAVVGAG